MTHVPATWPMPFDSEETRAKKLALERQLAGPPPSREPPNIIDLTHVPVWMVSVGAAAVGAVIALADLGLCDLLTPLLHRLCP